MTEPIVVALPTADRAVTFAFYESGLGFRAVGEPDGDGIPEPLQFELNEGVRLMFIPPGGFGWVTGGRETAGVDQSECLLSMTLPDQAAVRDLVERARGAGAEIVAEPADQMWGFTAVFADPDGHAWQLRSL